jgi:manganese transport protein
LLVLSQVILSLQLSFAVIPLIHFTSNRRNMGEFATPVWAQSLAWIVAAIIVALNGKLVLDSIFEWVELASKSGVTVLHVPLAWLVVLGLGTVVGAVALLLIHVTVKPIFWPSPAWKPTPSLEFNWNDALRPRPLQSIGVALEHTGADTEIMNRALSLATPGQTHLILLHVVDTPLSSVYGPQTADQHAEADSRYLDDLAAVLRDQGYLVDVNMLYGPDRAGRLVTQLRKEPVDLLVVGSHGHGLVRDLLFGQTVDKVRHNIEIPMLIARPDRNVGEAGSGTSRVDEATESRPV